MQYLTHIDMCPDYDLENELKHFFHRVHHIKRKLRQERDALVLNRIQRSRCKANLLDMETLENEFYAISYREDIKVLYRKVQRYVKLDHERLMSVFGSEESKRCSLFITL